MLNSGRTGRAHRPLDGVDLSGWADRPDSFPESARVWGVRTDPEQGSWERNRRNLDRMERGAPLPVYRNETSRYAASGRVGPMAHRLSQAVLREIADREDPYIGDAFWYWTHPEFDYRNLSDLREDRVTVDDRERQEKA